ncbi:hypothetical protein K461DRAFT_165209 [Myriangium duriaei CBS 260.36]|uniref:Uncharacterized protein n=1 Tax=Myriangium duriaei CBS 260.36 TaxID=1168546 RepID=A0A9P4MIH0_9PEZI|nr:hypothetical protein K461DRAFT_165209 [Myriangium duriaei CBS 260.36]
MMRLIFPRLPMRARSPYCFKLCSPWLGLFDPAIGSYCSFPHAILGQERFIRTLESVGLGYCCILSVMRVEFEEGDRWQGWLSAVIRLSWYRHCPHIE